MPHLVSLTRDHAVQPTPSIGLRLDRKAGLLLSPLACELPNEHGLCPRPLVQIKPPQPKFLVFHSVLILSMLLVVK